MKRMIVLTVVVLSMIFSTSFSFAETNWEEVALDMPDGFDIESMAMEALVKGVNVANATENHSAQEIMKFLMENHRVASPKYNEVFSMNIFAESFRSDGLDFCVVPLVRSDREAHNGWKTIYDKGLSAVFFFNPGNPFIAIRSGQFSSTWEGLEIIHQGSHILFYMANKPEGMYDWKRYEKMFYDEMNAYSIVAMSVEKIGGAAYKKLLDEEIERLKASYYNHDILPPNISLYNDRLEKIFGKVKSEEEKNVRGTTFWVNAYFRLIDQYCSNKSEKEKRNPSTGVFGATRDELRKKSGWENLIVFDCEGKKGLEKRKTDLINAAISRKYIQSYL